MSENPRYDAVIEQRLVPCQVTPCSEHNLIRLTEGHGTLRFDDKHALKYKDWTALDVIAKTGAGEPEYWVWFARLDEAKIEEIRRRQQGG